MWRWLAPILATVVILVIFGLGHRRRGLPVPSLFRRRRESSGDTVYRLDPDVAFQPPPPGWGLFGDLLWLIIALALAWLLLAMLVL